MIEFVRIESADEPLLDPVILLYETSFPIEERRPVSQLKHLIENQPKMFFNIVKYEGHFAGFFVYWDLDDFYYLEHFAVEHVMRNKKIGQQVLDYITENLKGLRILEVEPPTDDITKRRIGYYERNNYKILDKDYIQPSYDGEHDEYPLWIMGNKETDKLQEFLERIKEEIYRNNYNIS